MRSVVLLPTRARCVFYTKYILPKRDCMKYVGLASENFWSKKINSAKERQKGKKQYKYSYLYCMKSKLPGNIM